MSCLVFLKLFFFFISMHFPTRLWRPHYQRVSPLRGQVPGFLMIWLWNVLPQGPYCFLISPEPWPLKYCKSLTAHQLPEGPTIPLWHRAAHCLPCFWLTRLAFLASASLFHPLAWALPFFMRDNCLCFRPSSPRLGLDVSSADTLGSQLFGRYSNNPPNW